MTRREHINQLAAEMGVVIQASEGPYPGSLWSGPLETAGWLHQDPLTGRRWIDLYGYRPEDDQRAYFMALHELGHAAYNHTGASQAVFQERYWSRVLDAESEAWLWALEQALEEPEPETVEWAFHGTQAFGSYLRNYSLAHAGVPARRLASMYRPDLLNDLAVAA